MGSLLWLAVFLVALYLYLLIGYAIGAYSLKRYAMLLRNDYESVIDEVQNAILWPVATAFITGYDTTFIFFYFNRGLQKYYLFAMAIVWPLRLVWNICSLSIMVIVTFIVLVIYNLFLALWKAGSEPFKKLYKLSLKRR